MFVYYKHLVIKGHNDRFSHALSVRKYEEHNLDSLIENQCIHSAEHGCQSILIKASDTDIWVIAVSVYSILRKLGFCEFGQGKHLRCIPILLALRGVKAFYFSRLYWLKRGLVVS